MASRLSPRTASRSSRLGALAIVAGLAVVACGGSSDDAVSSSDDASDAPAEAPVDAASGILDFSAPLVGGGELDAQTLGDKPTAFWFWSPT